MSAGPNAEAQTLLTSRARHGALLVVGTLATLAVADLWAAGPFAFVRFGMTISLALAALGIALRIPSVSGEEQIGRIVVGYFALAGAGLVFADLLAGGLRVGPIIFATTALTTSALLPWAMPWQIATVTVCASLTLVEVLLLGPTLHAGMVLPALAVAAAYSLSLYTAWLAAKSRAALAEQSERLLAGDQRYRQVIQGSAAMVYEIELPDNRMTFLEADIPRVFGYESTIWRNDPELRASRVHEEDREVLERAAEALMSGERTTVNVEYRLRHRNGSIVWMQDHLHAIPDSSGSATSVRGIAFDISLSRRRADQLAQRSTELQAIGSAMTRYVRTREMWSSLDQLLEAAARAMSSERAFLCTKDENGYRVRVYGRPQPDRKSGSDKVQFTMLKELWSDDPGETIRRTFHSEQSVQCRAPCETDPGLPFLEDPRAPHFVVAPMPGSDGVRGVVGLADHQRHYEPFDRRDLETFAQAAATIWEAQLHLEQERNLRERSRRLVEILEMTPDPVATLDREGRYLYLNQAARKVVGVSATDDISHLSVADFYSAEVTDQIFSDVLGIVLKEGVWVGEMTLQAPDGRDIPFSQVVLAHRDPDGETRLLSAVSRDLTDRKAAEDAIRRANTELESRVAERTELMSAAINDLEAFSYSVSHDLRSPLRRIDGFASVVEEDFETASPTVTLENVQRIREAARSMDGLITSMLEFSRNAHGDLHRSNVHLSDIAREVAEGLKAGEPARSVQFQIQSTDAVRADPALARIVVENLVNNAWKYTSHRQDAEIEFGAQGKNESGVFYIRDNGVGFDMSKVAKLFVPFERLHSSSDFPGTGVGLATVQRILRRHGGSIWAQAAEDEGATFFFRFS